MSQQGLETIESTTQKTHEWISQIAETPHMEKRDAYKALRAVLQTVRVPAAGGSCRAFRRATSDAVARSLLRRMGGAVESAD